MSSSLNSSSVTPPPALASDRWCIDGALTIGTIADWHSRFAERIATTQELELDLAGVTAADVFGLQLLYSVRRSAIEGGRTLKITAIPSVIQTAASATGFSLNF